MQKKIVDISDKIIDELSKRKESLMAMNTKNPQEKKVVLDFIGEINVHLYLLDIIKEESSDEEYIHENKFDIKRYLNEVRSFVREIPTK